MTPAEARAQLGDEALVKAGQHACWRRGTLRYRFSEIQREFRELFYSHVARLIVWLTCRRFGKSRSACGIAAEYALRYPGMWIPYAASTGIQVRNFVTPHFMAIANEAPPELAPEQVGIKWVFPPMQWYDAEGNPVRTHADGGVEVTRFRGNQYEEGLRQSRIITAGCEDNRKADRLRGPGTGVVFVDEARDIPILEYVLSEVFGPMLWEARHVWGDSIDPKMLAPSTAPREADHPFVTVIERAIDRGAYCHATVYDCDHLDDRAIAEAIEEAGGEDSVAWKREGLAELVRDPELAVYPEFDEACIGEHEQPDHFLPHVIADTGFVDMDVVAFGYFDFVADLYVIEAEVVMRRARSDELDRAVREMERELWGDRKVHRRRADAPPKVRADMSSADLQDDESEGGRHWNPVSRDGGEGKGRMRAFVNRVRKVAKEGRLLVHPRCVTIIKHAQFARWDKNRKSFVRVKDSNGEPLHHYDGGATLAYFVRDVDTTTNPYPRLPKGVTRETHHIPPALQEDARARRLQKAFGRRRRR